VDIKIAISHIIRRSLCLLERASFDSWIKIDQLDVTCFIFSPFTAQHISNISTSIFRSLQAFKLLKMDVLAFETCWAVNSEIIKQVTSSWSIFIQYDDEVYYMYVYPCGLLVNYIAVCQVTFGSNPLPNPRLK